MEKAEEGYQKARKNKIPNIPKYPTFSAFHNIYHPLFSHVLYKIIFYVLYFTHQDPGKFTETLLNETLHLLHLSLSLFNPLDISKVKDDEIIATQTQRKRKATFFVGNISNIEFPTSFDITQNSRHEITVASSHDEPKKTESIIGLLRKLQKVQQFSHQSEKMNQILGLFAEKDISCKQYIESLAGKEKQHDKDGSKDEEDEQEVKRRRREMQQAIRMKFSQEMMKFSAEVEDLEDEDEDKLNENQEKKYNPFEGIANCALCQEETTLTRPLGYVGFVQLTKILQLSKELQSKRSRILYLEPEDPRGPMTPKYESESEGEGEFIYSDNEEDEDEHFMVERDADRMSRAQSFMFGLMQDPILEGMGIEDEDDFDSDDDDDEMFFYNPTIHSDVINEEGEGANNPAGNDSAAPPESSGPTNEDSDESEEEVENDEDVIYEDDDDVIYEDDLLDNSDNFQIYEQVSNLLNENDHDEDLATLEKGFKDIEMQLEAIENDPSQLEDKAVALEDAIQDLEHELEFLTQHAETEETLQPMEKVLINIKIFIYKKQRIKELRERFGTLLRHFKKPIFDLTKGAYLNIQYCNNHTIHFDCMERYSTLFS